MDIDDFILTKMESDYIFLIAVMIRGPKFRNMADIPRRFILKDILISDWYYKHSKVNILDSYVIKCIAAEWSNGLPYFDIVFHCNEIHTIKNMLRINMSEAWYVDKSSLRIGTDIDGILLLYTYDVDDLCTKFKLCDEIKMIFNKYKDIINTFPVGTCYSFATPPAKEQVVLSIHALLREIQEYTMDSIYDDDNIKTRVLEICHDISNEWINNMFSMSLRDKMTVYDTIELLELAHYIFQMNRYMKLPDVSETEWRGLYE